MIALVGGTLWLTALQDRAEGVKERERVKASFVARIEAVAATTRVFAVWDDAARKLVAGFDPAWTDINIGAYVFDQEGFEATFVDRSRRGARSTAMSIPSGRRPIRPVVLGSGYAAAIRRIVAARPRWPTSRSAGSAVAPRGTAIFSIVRIRPHGPIFGVPLQRQPLHRHGQVHRRAGRQTGRARVQRRRPCRSATHPPRGLSSWSFAPFDGRRLAQLQLDPRPTRDAPVARRRAVAGAAHPG